MSVLSQYTRIEKLEKHLAKACLPMLKGFELRLALAYRWDELPDDTELKAALKEWRRDDDNGYSCGYSSMRNIVELMEAYKQFDDEERDFEENPVEFDGGEYKSRYDMDTRIWETGYGVSYRTLWINDRNEVSPDDIGQAKLELAGGGPAAKLECDIGAKDPSAKVYGQDWYTPWFEIETSGHEQDMLNEFCERYFGE